MNGAIQTHNYQGPEYFCFVLFFFVVFLEGGGFFSCLVGGRKGNLKYSCTLYLEIM